jgi:hypothetical protein
VNKISKGNPVSLSDNITNGGEAAISTEMPYMATVRIRGTSDMLFHAWNAEAVDEKAKAKKGSEAKKTDNIESYVYRDEKGFLALPGEYLRGSVINAAKFRQDPRSPRKSAQDLFKAGVISLTQFASLGKKAWDYEDRRRVVVQRNGINRTRPAMRVGWEAEFKMMINTPEYIDESLFREVLDIAGRLVGVGDFRPTYGRFSVVGFSISEA